MNSNTKTKIEHALCERERIAPHRQLRSMDANAQTSGLAPPSDPIAASPYCKYTTTFTYSENPLNHHYQSSARQTAAAATVGGYPPNSEKSLQAMGLSLADFESLGNNICTAVHEGNLEMVRAFADSMGHFLPEVRGPYMRTPLIVAAHKGDPDVCEFLIGRKIHVNAQDSDGVSALHAACEAGHFSVAKVLLKHGADVNLVSRDVDLSTPLSLAIGFGNPELAELLVREGKAKMDIEDPSIREGVRFLVEFEQSLSINQEGLRFNGSFRGLHHRAKFREDLDTATARVLSGKLLQMGTGKTLTDEMSMMQNNEQLPLKTLLEEYALKPPRGQIERKGKVETMRDQCDPLPYRQMISTLENELMYLWAEDDEMTSSVSQRKMEKLEEKNGGGGRYSKREMFAHHKSSDIRPCACFRTRCERALPMLLKKFPKLAQIKIAPGNVTLLHLCARKRLGHCVHALLSCAGVKDDVRTDKEGYLALHEACASGSSGLCLQSLIEWHKEKSEWKNLEEKESRFGMTAVLVAAERGRFGTIDILKRHGARVDAVSNGGYSIHHLLALNLGTEMSDGKMRTYFFEGSSSRWLQNNSSSSSSSATSATVQQHHAQCVFDQRTKDGFSPFFLATLKDVIHGDWIHDSLHKRSEEKDHRFVVQRPHYAYGDDDDDDDDDDDEREKNKNNNDDEEKSEKENQIEENKEKQQNDNNEKPLTKEEKEACEEINWDDEGMYL